MSHLIKLALLSAVVLAGTGMASSFSTEAQAGPKIFTKKIMCPLTMAKRKIVTPLPNKWWTTPMNSPLTQTKVVKIGGKKSLMCVYGASGSIQRYAPKNRKCKAVNKGFKCKLKLAFIPGVIKPGFKIPKTHKTGPIVVPQTYQFDLDSGHVVSGPKADVWFQAKTATKRYLTPRNGAVLSVSGKRNRGYKGCKTANYSTGDIRLRQSLVGTYICVRTAQGRISEFRINGLTNGNPKILKVGFTTWK